MKPRAAPIGLLYLGRGLVLMNHSLHVSYNVSYSFFLDLCFLHLGIEIIIIIITIWKLVKRMNPSNSCSLRYKQENKGTWKVNAIPKNKDKTIKIPYKIHYKSLTKARVKRWVFNAVLKAHKVLQFLMWVGRWFHSLGAQIANCIYTTHYYLPLY